MRLFSSKLLINLAKSCRKLTLSALALEVKISRQAIAAYMDGKGTPDANMIAMLCQYFKVSADYLLGLSDYREGVPQLPAADLSSDTLEAILSALEHEPLKWQAFVYLLIFTGARRGELLGLKWSDIDGDTIHIQRNAQYLKGKGIYITTPKTGKGRFLSVPIQAIDKLEAWHKEQALIQEAVLGETIADGYVFTQKDARGILSPSTVNKFLSGFSKRNALPPLHAHAFRHTQAALLINAGVDILTISKRLGHDRVSTTLDIYGHMISNADKAAARELEGLLKKY